MRNRRRGGIGLGRVAKKAAVATVVSRVVSNAMDQRMTGNNMHLNRQMNQNFHQQPMMQQQPVMTRSCPSCQMNNPQNAKFCSNCGGDFNVQTTAQNTPTPPSACPGCKANLIGITGNFCPYCRSAIG